MTEPNGMLTWRWLGGILMSIVLLGGGGWMTHMATEVDKVKQEQKQDRERTQEVKEKVGVIEEQTKRTREDVKEIKETQKDTNRKLDELLRRR
ncbi:MAG: hypothetical protein U1C74_15920 [Phenylobacterium sp.]|nr:hypothetical protein [Candidatus Omnitrophota bacterium]MDZ4372896.1 hypothetical protein [Phenylobacterium sp.]